MPPRKYVKRKSTRRRPVARRRFNTSGKRTYRRKVPSATLRVKRMVYAGTLAPANNLSTGTSYFWQYQTVSLAKSLSNFDGTSTSLGGLTNLAEYQSLFEQYRLGGYKVHLRPKLIDLNSDAVVASGTAAPLVPNELVPPQFIILKDPRSTITPSGTYSAATMNALLEGGGKIYRADKPISIYIKPLCSEQYGGLGANRYVRPKYTDLNTTAGTQTPHNGFHMFLFRQGFNQIPTNLSWDVFITYYLTFKNSK